MTSPSNYSPRQNPNLSHNGGTSFISFPSASLTPFSPRRSWTLNDLGETMKMTKIANPGSENSVATHAVRGLGSLFYNDSVKLSSSPLSMSDKVDKSTYQSYNLNGSSTVTPSERSWGSNEGIAEFLSSTTVSHVETEDLPGINGILVVAGVTFSLLALSTAVGNALVLHAIRTEKKLQTVSNLFIMSLAIADLTVGLIVMPISAAYFVAGEWRWGMVVCQIWLSVDYTASTASIFNLVILSLDRYWSVSNPLRYLSKRTRKRALVLIGGTWAAASLWLIPLLAWHHIFYEGERQHPSHVCETEFSDSITFKVVTSVLNFYGPSTLMMYLYFRIFQTIKLRSLDLLGRVTPMETSTTNQQKAPRNHQKKTFRNLTLLALPEADNDADLSPSFYKGIVVQVEYIAEQSSSESDSSKEETNNLNGRSESGFSKMLSCRLSRSKQNMCNNSFSVKGNRKDNQNHQNHLACFPHSSTGWSKPDISASPSLNESLRSPSFQNTAAAKVSASSSFGGGFRGLFQERRGVTGTTSNVSSSSGSNDRRNGPINIAKEKKAAKQLGMIMVAFFSCWIPYFALFPVIAFCDGCITERVHMAVTWLGYFNSLLNPIIYPLCNVHFRRAFSRMLRCKKRSPRHIPSVAFLQVPY